MPSVAATIVKVISDAFPTFVECHLVDADGTAHIIHDKLPVVWAGNEWDENSLPITCSIDCAIVKAGAQFTIIDLEFPWGIETITGETRITVATETVTTD